MRCIVVAVDRTGLSTVLRALGDWGRRRVLQLYLSDSVPSSHELNVDLSGRELHDALEEASHQRLIRGELTGGDDLGVFWARLHLTIAGLRRIGQWPPAGKEASPGPWEHGAWGAIDRSVLADIDEHLPQHRYIFALGDEGDHERLAVSTPRYWEAVRRLVEAAFLDGTLQIQGLQDARLTLAGREVLSPAPVDPLREAERDAALGNHRQAAVTAGVALEDRLRELARRRGRRVFRDGKTPRRAAELNQRLKTAGLYGNSERAHVDAWLAVRNAAAHPREEDPRALVAPMITGVREFFERHPV